jgi:uncharacterized protein Yka (UPF0111/DUF47 family)
LDTLVQGSVREGSDVYRIPGAGRVHEQIVDHVKAMLAPLQKAATELDGDHSRADEYQRRLETLAAQSPSFAGDLISGAYIDQVTSPQPATGDSLHLLVMNLHKELNRLQQKIAAESIDGASVYGVTDSDRRMIAAFMRGVNRTRKLKFDHPGLDTTATRSQDKLIIQNDIGTTDAHVLVIHVTDSQVAVTYTDVHIQRLAFFQDTLKRFEVHWEDTRSRLSTMLAEKLYHLCVGRYMACEEEKQASYLEFLGSRLVFLIDWNRARKRLRKLAPKRVCLDVLQWAADNDLGHMAFLNVGGEQLVLDAMQLSAQVPMQIGRQLSDIIGPERAGEFLKFTLRTASEGLLAGHSELLIRDQVRAELREYLNTLHQGLLELAAEHATLIVELAIAARDCLLLPDGEVDPEFPRRTARRAKKWEHLADGLVTKARTARGDWAESQAAAELLRIADDAADELEEGIFLLTLLEQPSGVNSGHVSGESREALEELADQLVRAAQEYLKVVENAKHIHRGSSREEMAAFLEAVDQTISLEHQTDDVHRRAKTCVRGFTGDFKQLYFFTAVADKLESAADAMMRAALLLKDYVLGEAITR